MPFWKRSNDPLADDIKSLRTNLERIVQLEALGEFPAWKEMRREFERIITKHTQDAIDMCSDPIKNALEIKTKKLVASSLGSLLAWLDRRVGQRGVVMRQLNERLAENARNRTKGDL